MCVIDEETLYAHVRRLPSHADITAVRGQCEWCVVRGGPGWDRLEAPPMTQTARPWGRERCVERTRTGSAPASAQSSAQWTQ